MIQVFRKFDRPNSVTKLYANIHDEISKNHLVDQIFCPNPNSGILNKIRNIVWLYKSPGHFFHLTGDNSYLGWALICRRCPYLVTLLDFGMPGRRRWIHNVIISFFYFSIPLFFAKRIICISEFTKMELFRKYKRYEGKSYVIYVSLSENYIINYGFHETVENIDDAIYVLQIATSDHNKNVERCITAMANTGYCYLFVGDLSMEYIALLNDFNVNYFCFKNINEEKLIELYDKSTILLFPSLYEGFGMPIIEAQARGISVITSNIPPMSEIAGEGAILVDPYNVNDINNALMRLGADFNLRLGLKKKGFKNIDRFSPKFIAEQHVTLYKWIEKIF